MGQSQSADAKSHYESVLEKQDDSKGGGYVWRGRGTVKVFHNVKLGTLYGSVQASMKATLDGTLDMKDAVALPSNTDINEWIAVNSIHFFNTAVMVYATCSSHCTLASCPVMNAGEKYEYRWADGVNVKHPIKCSAPEYMNYLFDWGDSMIADPSVFPEENDPKFSRKFLSNVKTLLTRLYRVYAHVYYSHFEEVKELGGEAHLNTCFKHLTYFIFEFDLIPRDELEPLKKLILKIIPEEEYGPM